MSTGSPISGSFWLVMLAFIQLITPKAQANVFSLPTGQTSLVVVPIGDPGNAPDPTTGSHLGSVAYAYSIGEYDVTAGQYTAFLNAVAATDTTYLPLYNSYMAATSNGQPGITRSGPEGNYTYAVASSRVNHPMTFVTFWDAARFVNWLENGQPTGQEGPGTTETGTYTLTSDSIANDTVSRNANSIWAIASQDEWYKAACYDPSISGYWAYPTRSNTISTSQANCLVSGRGLNDTTIVGSYPYPSYYGTYDQGGDVAQWTDTVINGSYQDMRGGDFANDASLMKSTYNYISVPNAEGNWFGFRVVKLSASPVPEPAAAVIFAFSALFTLSRRR